MKCHVCEDVIADFNCCQCDDPVCEDCCVVPTYMNQIEETICNVCGDNNECDRAEEAKREYEADEKQKEKREAINLKRRETYWKPENIQKRRLAKIQRNKERFERNRKIIEETFNIVNSMFR